MEGAESHKKRQIQLRLMHDLSIREITSMLGELRGVRWVVFQTVFISFVYSGKTSCNWCSMQKMKQEERKSTTKIFRLKVLCSFLLDTKPLVPHWRLLVITLLLIRMFKKNWETRLTACGLKRRWVSCKVTFVRLFCSHLCCILCYQ